MSILCIIQNVVLVIYEDIHFIPKKQEKSVVGEYVFLKNTQVLFFKPPPPPPHPILRTDCFGNRATS